MTLEENIRSTIQQIGGIFIIKNIRAVPVNVEYLDVEIAPGMEKLVMTELIMYLEDLFRDYLQEERKMHKYSHYVARFKQILDDNCEGSNLVGIAKRTA